MSDEIKYFAFFNSVEAMGNLDSMVEFTNDPEAGWGKGTLVEINNSDQYYPFRIEHGRRDTRIESATFIRSIEK